MDKMNQLELENKRLKEEIAQATKDKIAYQKVVEEKTFLQEQYEKSKLRFQSIFEKSHLGNKIINKDLIITEVNQALLSLLGYTHKKELINRRISEFSHPDFIDHWHELQVSLWEKKIPVFSLNTCLVRKDGSDFWVRVTSILFEDEGNTLGYTILEDINERKILEAALEKKREEQQKVISDRDIFVYTVSHDLIAPLSNIEGLVNSLKRKHGDPETFENLLSMMYKSIDKFKSKIRELSAIGKEQEEARIDEVDIEFQEILNDILFDIEHEIKDVQAEIVSDFSKAPIVMFSKKNLKIILQNLVSNAVKYRSPERKIKVILETEKINNYVLLKVQDNGVGIKEEDKDKVFQMYQRLHDHAGGTGLGMGIVKRILDNSKGKVELDSKPGKGSTFKIYLPADSK